MFKSYLTVALRHLTTQKLYSLINVAGLAIGLTCFILIALFVRHELGYDRHFSRAEDIYRISRDFYAAGGAEWCPRPPAAGTRRSDPSRLTAGWGRRRNPPPLGGGGCQDDLVME